MLRFVRLWAAPLQRILDVQICAAFSSVVDIFGGRVCGC